MTTKLKKNKKVLCKKKINVIDKIYVLYQTFILEKVLRNLFHENFRWKRSDSVRRIINNFMSTTYL